MDRRTRLVLIAALSAFAWLAVAVLALVSAQAAPLSITLSGPAVCETDAHREWEVKTVTFEWVVSGGAAPYDVLVNGERFDSAEGAAAVPCGRRLDGYGSLPEITSGITTIQATVIDADGRSASALHDLYSLRVLNQKGIFPPILRGGETYRVHGLLLTAPGTLGFRLGPYLSADCPIPAETCGDRFRLDGGGVIWIYRWSGLEHSRFLNGSPGSRSGLHVRPGDEVEIPHHHQWVDDAYNELLASAGKPPRLYADARSAGSSSGRMSLTLQSPAICEAHGDLKIQVAWAVTGGSAPYEVTIAGDRYLGEQGVAEVLCGQKLGATDDSPLQHIQGTAVDAAGDTAAARADVYAIPATSIYSRSLSVGTSYRMNDLLITIPQGVDSASLDRTEREYCPEPPPTPYTACEPGTVFTINLDGEDASIVLGAYSNREYQRTIAESGSPELTAKLEQLAASIGAAPQLPDDFIDASAPLRITAFVSDTACYPREYVNVYASAVGGWWWPLHMEGENRIRCGDEPGTEYVELRATESGPAPAVVHLRQPIEVLSEASGISLELYAPDDRSRGLRCVAGGQVTVQWHATIRTNHYRTSPAPSLTVRIDDINGVVPEHGRRQIDCPKIAGRHPITIEAEANTDPPFVEAATSVIVVTNARPERLEQ